MAKHPTTTETREEWLGRAMAEMAGWLTVPFPQNVRVSCGFPSVSALANAKRRVGECWASICSQDNSFEIFISPVLGKAEAALAVLVHEMIHAAVGLECGHKGAFKREALAVGLEGKMTSTTPGEKLAARLNALAAKLGRYPHAELAAMTNGRKKQGTRLIKVECPECGYTVRTTSKWITQGLPTCPCGCEMVADEAEECDEAEGE